jgi:glucose/arabinose dehydrogenase
MKHFVISLFACLFVGTIQETKAQIVLNTTVVDTQTVAVFIDIPWEIIWGPDNFIWMTERFGRISRVDPQSTQQHSQTVLLDVYAENESGLMGMVLHPNFVDTPWVFVAYTYRNGLANYLRIVRFDFVNNQLIPADTLLNGTPANTTHVGCRLLITPDRKLLVTLGDIQNLNTPQSLGNRNGKILRLNLDGSIPADNPFNFSWVWSLGHRNPQGLVLHPNGKLYSTEHGPTADDELNIIEAGGNYGWPTVSGLCNTPAEITFCNDNNVIEPIASWTPTLAVSDLLWYSHPSIPEFNNRLLMTTLKDKSLHALELNASGDAVVSQESYLTNRFGRLRDICTAPDGSIYLATNGENWTNDNPYSHRVIKLWNASYTPTAVSKIDKGLGIQLKGNPLQTASHLLIPDEHIGVAYQLYDNSGRLLKKGQLNENQVYLHDWELSAGSYYLLLHKQQLSQRIRFIR